MYTGTAGPVKKAFRSFFEQMVIVDKRLTTVENQLGEIRIA